MRIDGPVAWKGLEKAAYIKLQLVHAQREEIMTAFIAKYGFEPERCVQVHKRCANGNDEWYVRRLSDEEMKELSLNSAGL